MERLKTRQERLIADNLISQELYDATLDELDYLKNVQENLKARQKLEESIRKERLQQIETQIAKLEDNLIVSQTSFENLLVKAPVAGQLTSFPAEIGENKITRRDINVGRRNNRYMELLSGLSQGDRVITSSYNTMVDMERIQLTE